MAKTRDNSSPKTENSDAKAAKVRAEAKSPTYEDIAVRAYNIYLERNGAPGDPFEDWVRAEQELTQDAPKPRRKLGPKLVAA